MNKGRPKNLTGKALDYAMIKLTVENMFIIIIFIKTKRYFEVIFNTI